MIGGLVVVGVAVAVGLFVTREDPGPRPVGEAVRDFRASTTMALDPEAGSGPEPGVYQLVGEGREAISFPPVEQSDGATMPMTISDRSEGCWRVRIDYNEAHWQNWDLCRDGDTVTESTGRTWQRWDFGAAVVDNLSTFTCEPPAVFVVFDAESGTVIERSCMGISEAVSGTATSDGTVTVIGNETVPIDGEEVEAIHLRYRNDFSGAQTGQEDLELWLSIADGLPLRGERTVTIDSDSPVGTVTYTEEGTWSLRSTVPDR